VLLAASSTFASGLFVSLGMRETNVNGPVGADGGATGAIEWINRDGQFVEAGTGWKLIKFDMQNDPVTAFTGDGLISVDFGTIEHLRLLNDGGATQYRLYIDEITQDNNGIIDSVSDFEAFAVGDEVVFQEPTFSGSTSGNLVGGTSGITDTMAYAGNQSYLAEFEFVDDDPTRWVRLTTFNAANVPNPIIETLTGSNVLSMYVKVEQIPEPTTAALALVAIGVLGLRLLRRR
jgi:hypothetical protein